ncbi:MAG: inorganic phosphate transporter [Bryobacteraceae bacterium]
MFSDLSSTSIIFLFLAVALALAFEFVNGFHDTANAVATVIYTNSLKSTQAVVWSGAWNFLGVLTSSGAVAFGILALLPVELILTVGSAAGFAMVFSLLLSAIIWNLGTWYLGLPASSSHTLIGSILGVGMANAMLKSGATFGDGVNWEKAREVGISLLVSPLFGFAAAAALLLAMKMVVKRPELYREPEAGKTPPLWIRCILILTCTGVSFAHGSNDGQKGMGLILLILIGILPGSFAVNLALEPSAISRVTMASQSALATFAQRAGGAQVQGPEAAAEISAFLQTHQAPTARTFASLAGMTADIGQVLDGQTSLSKVVNADRVRLRTEVYLVSEAITHLTVQGLAGSQEESAGLLGFRYEMEGVIRYIPIWVKLAVALALGCGTMIGWKRIVVTVGEKIGKTHLSYAQGAAAETVAALTIAAADIGGWPVSTTHVLSSGVAGTMAANHSGLQMNTMRNLLLAWVLTLPVCVFLGAMLFALGINIVVGLGLR